MSKRKLSRKQAWRIQKIQEERIKRAQKKISNSELDINTAASSESHNGRVIACFGVNYLIESEQGEHINCIARQNLGNIVVGDQCVWQVVDQQNGVITALLPRLSILERPNFHGNTKPVAANVDQIFIVCSPIPALQTQLIDRYLVAVELTGIKAVIVVNKTDLLDKAIEKGGVKHCYQYLMLVLNLFMWINIDLLNILILKLTDGPKFLFVISISARKCLESGTISLII